MFKDKTILITGGAGSLGRELVRHLLSYGPEKIIVYSRDEAKHAKYYSNTEGVKCVVGDIRDYDKLKITTKNVDCIFHAGALKRIDTVEYNPIEAIKTNIDGSINVARAALENNVEKAILISTDKACMNINSYGATKFLAEKVFSYFDTEFGDNTIFSSVRYGNVIASRGSFIPLWLEHIKSGVPLPLTIGHMTRFLFTLEDAANTVITAIKYSKGGEIFVPNIKSYMVYDIMKVLCDYYGIELKVKEIGKRVGEKMHEDMIMPTELERTYIIGGLYAILPEITRREYDKSKKYNGEALNSKFFVEKDENEILKLLKRGANI